MVRMSAANDQHDDDEDLPCYRHPDRLTALACITCERPICPECAIAAPVGFKCPECAKQPRAALGKVPTARLVMGSAAATFVAFALGTALSNIRFGYIGFILSFLFGMLIGEIARRAAGGYRDSHLAVIASVAAAGGLLWAVGFNVFLRNVHYDVASLVFAFIGAAVAAYAAHNRAN
jgi:hypothetical protein